MSSDKMFLVTVSPHIHHKDSTSRIMLDVIIALIPAGIWGIYIFGVDSLTVISVSIISAVLAEYAVGRLSGNNTLGDYSALLTGILVGYNMPPGVDLYVPVIASVFAVIVVKWTFGGLGANIVNPALAGRLFVTFSWTGAMTRWSAPSTNTAIDGIAGASPLGAVKTELMDLTGAINGPVEVLKDYPVSSMGSSISSWFSTAAGTEINPVYFDLLIGNISGCIGEVSALLLAAGAVYLLARKVITWEIPGAYLLSFALMVWIFDGLRFGTGYFSGDVFFHLFTGGLMLGAFYMATDMVTSPLTAKGQIIFGIGCGLLTYLIRAYGSFPEGVSLAILFMNIFVTMLDRITGPKLFGYIPREKRK